MCIAWCKWSDMLVRIDKCTKFGMTKRGGQYIQFQSGIFMADIAGPSILSFDIKTYNLSTTWVTENLDSKIYNALRSWLELPIRTCLAEVWALSQKKGGHNIRSLKTTAQILRLCQRIRLKNSGCTRMEILWQVTSAQFPTTDEHITDSNPYVVVPVRKLKEKSQLEAWSHVQSLPLQGALLKSLSASLGASSIKKWTCHVWTMTSPIFDIHS